MVSFYLSVIENLEPEKTLRTSFSCNGTSELPRHIQDVRERMKRELGVTANLHLTDEERKLLGRGSFFRSLFVLAIIIATFFSQEG